MHQGHGFLGIQLLDVGSHLHADSATTNDDDVGAADDFLDVFLEVGDVVRFCGVGERRWGSVFRAGCKDLGLLGIFKYLGKNETHEIRVRDTAHHFITQGDLPIKLDS
jgi:hypothetical protein